MTATNHRINEAVSSHVAPVSEPAAHHQPPHTPAQLSRTQILEATFFCLREEGYEATTIRRIAKRLDCAIGSIYRYFKDKRDLLSAVTQELLQPVVVGLENGSPIDRSIGMYCRLATGDAEAYRLMFWLACKSLGWIRCPHSQPRLPYTPSHVAQQVLILRRRPDRRLPGSRLYSE